MATISKDTFKFLKDIAKNNNRDWFTENKPKYVLATDNTKAFAAELAEMMSSHDSIEGPKVFRIYREDSQEQLMHYAEACILISSQETHSQVVDSGILMDLTSKESETNLQSMRKSLETY